jgi:hypothetical protein
MRAFLFVLTILVLLGIIVVSGDCTKCGAIGGLAAALMGLLPFRKRFCPVCGTRKPPVPDMKSFSDWWYKHWYCPVCGTHLTRGGKRID